MGSNDPSPPDTGPEQFGGRSVVILDKVFGRAKRVSEFEYACALLRVRGMEAAGWDPLVETQQLVADMLALIHSPLRDDTRLRLALLTYCHLTEVDAIYAVIDNILTVTEGERCAVRPFRHLYRKSEKGKSPWLARPLPPSAARVVMHLKEHAIRAGENELAAIVEQMFDDQIRNSFFHSDYILFAGEFRTREGRFAKGDTWGSAITLEELTSRINRGLGFYHAFMEVYAAHIRSYDTSKVVTGRFLADGVTEVPIELLADPERGLFGFRSPPSVPGVTVSDGG